MRKSLTLIIVAILIGYVSIAQAITDKAKKESREEALLVKNSKGESVGTIKDALTDSSGNIVFVILSLTGGESRAKEVAVPLTAFSYDSENETIVLDVSNEQLAAAPQFEESDLNDPGFPGRVYQFFGQAPAWTGE